MLFNNSASLKGDSEDLPLVVDPSRLNESKLVNCRLQFVPDEYSLTT